MAGLGPQGKQLLDEFINASAAPFELTGESTVDDARNWLLDRVLKGAPCPVCAREARVWRRDIHSNIAYGLVLLYKAGANGTFIHKPTVLKGKGSGSRDESIARYWGLLEEERTVKRDDGGRAGYWRLTPRGVAFVRGAVTIPAYALVYNKKCLGLEGPPRTIQDCLGKRFDYQELMDGLGLADQGSGHTASAQDHRGERRTPDSGRVPDDDESAPSPRLFDCGDAREG